MEQHKMANIRISEVKQYIVDSVLKQEGSIFKSSYYHISSDNVIEFYFMHDDDLTEDHEDDLSLYHTEFVSHYHPYFKNIIFTPVKQLPDIPLTSVTD